VALASASDGDLVRRYAADRDDLAFAELVHRFAPAVYALCRRHLSDPGTADDAFQAVFVLLARKAGTLAHPDRVGGWLVGVADRVARTARRRQAKRNESLRPLDTVPEPVAPSVPASDLRVILDDELTKLPPHYRAVVMLCDVDGVPRREAATRLGIPTGTLSNRLTRARAVLGRRLLRRGVLVAGGAVLSGGTAVNASPNLLAVAVRVALSDAPPPTVLSLLRPEMTPMPRGKLLLLLVGGLVLTGVGITGAVLLVKGPNPSPTTEGEQAKADKPNTPVTSVMSAEEVMRRQPKPRLPQDRTGAFAFTQDGRRVVSAPNDWDHQDSKVVVYGTADWKPVATLDIVREDAVVTGMAITPDSKRVFMTGFRGGNIRVWDTVANKFEEKQLDIGGVKFDRWQIRLSPDGKSLVGGLYSFEGEGVGHVRVWDVTTGEVVRTVRMPHTAADKFTFADGGKTIAAVIGTGTREDRRCWVSEWDLDSGKEKRRIDLGVAGGDRGPPVACALAYTADGKHVVVGGGFQLPDDRRELPPNSYRKTFQLSGSVWVIDRETGKLVKTLVDHRHDLVWRLHATPDGKKVIVNPTLPSRWDREFGDPTADEEFVELQQWDAATWELDWVKIVPKGERWKLWNGAAK